MRQVIAISSMLYAAGALLAKAHTTVAWGQAQCMYAAV